MRPRAVQLVPVSPDKFDELRSRSDVKTVPEGPPRLGVDFNNPDESLAYTGYCEKFDLDDTEDRVNYAQLKAKLCAGQEYMLLWEERNAKPDGGIAVYITYLRALNVLEGVGDSYLDK